MNIYDGSFTHNPSKESITGQNFGYNTSLVTNSMNNNDEVKSTINDNIKGLYDRKIDNIKKELKQLQNEIATKNEELHQLSVEKNKLKLRKSEIKREYRSISSKSQDFSKQINELEVLLARESKDLDNQLKERVKENEKIDYEITKLKDLGNYGGIDLHNIEIDKLVKEIHELDIQFKRLQEKYNSECTVNFEKKKELSLSNLKLNLENDLKDLNQQFIKLEPQNQKEKYSIKSLEESLDKELFMQYKLLLESQNLKKITKIYVLEESGLPVRNEILYDTIENTDYKFGKIFTNIYECSVFLKVFLKQNLLNKRILIILIDFENLGKVLETAVSYINSVTEDLRINSKSFESNIASIIGNQNHKAELQDFQTILLSGAIFQKSINLACDISCNPQLLTSQSESYDDTLIIFDTTGNEDQLNTAFRYNDICNKSSIG